MASPYHQSIKNYIAEYGSKLKKVDSISKARQNPIPLPHPYPLIQAVPLYYDPDVIYTLKRTEKKVIFEIADKQSKNDTIADIIRAYLCNFRVHKLFFIVPDDKKYKKHDTTQKIIIASLSKKLKKNKLPVDILVVKIPESKLKSKKSIFNILDKEIQNEI